MTYCGPFVPHFPRRTSTLRRRLASPLAIHRYGFTRLGSLRLRSRTQEAVDAIQAILFYRAQPSVPPPTIPASRCALPASSASSRRPVSARSLRCGLRSSFLVAAPSLRLVATTRLRTTPHRKLASCRSPPRDIVPPGLVMRRPSGPPCLRRVRSNPCSRLPAEDCDALRVRRWSLRSGALKLRGRPVWRHPAERDGGHPAHRRRSREHQRALWFRRLASAN